MTGPDSVMVRAFSSEAGGAGSNPGRVIPKTLKMVPVATLLGAQHYKASTGFSSLNKITSMMGAPCNTLFMRCLEYLADWQIQIGCEQEGRESTINRQKYGKQVNSA